MSAHIPDTATGHGVTRVNPQLADRTRHLSVVCPVSTSELNLIFAAVEGTANNLGDYVRDAVLARIATETTTP